MTNKFMLAFALLVVSSAPAMAQDSPAGFDSRWNPYLGCWTVAQEQMGQQPISVPAGTMVCVRPSGRSGVAITTTVDGKNVLEQTIVADGSAQPLTQGDCSGTQTSDWSRDGERLFTRVTLNCTGRPARNVSGITMMAKGNWVDLQATVIDNDHDLRVRRYRRSSEQYTGMPVQTSAPLNVEDVVEASAKVASPAVEAALLEAGGRFTLTSRVLRQLADAKVSPNVIDLMIAQAYPERFDIDSGGGYPPATVASGSTYSGGSSSVVMGSSMYPYPIYDPFYSSYYYYSPFAYPYYWGSGYRYRYGYPIYRNYYGGYDLYGFGYPGYYYGGGSINPGDHAQPGSPDSRGGSGIATGRGYTRVRPSGSGSGDSGESATPSNRGGSVGRGVRGIDSGSSSSSGSSGSSNSGSSGSSGGTSSGGYSSGGGGNSGGGGRTAQPR
jgi:hypothetical protein